MSDVLIRRCATCRQKVFVADHGDVEPIGAARIVKVTADGDTQVQCVCGRIESWTRRRNPAVVR
ncbi:MAG: hypothetical protein AB7P40_00025 [Chloroflexota bacterium]